MGVTDVTGGSGVNVDTTVVEHYTDVNITDDITLEKDKEFTIDFTKTDNLSKGLSYLANFENTVYYKVIDNKLEFTENESEAVIKMVRNESENKAIMTLINTDDNKSYNLDFSYSKLDRSTLTYNGIKYGDDTIFIGDDIPEDLQQSGSATIYDTRDDYYTRYNFKCKLNLIVNPLQDIEVGGTYNGFGMEIYLNNVRVGTESANVTGTAKGYTTGSIKNKITIQLSFGDGNIGSITAKEKETITLPIAVKEGYIFNGWTNESGEIIPSIYVVTKDITLKATWISETADTITIKFDTDGGSKIDDMIVVKGETLKLPQNPTKEGYKFKTWVDKNETPIYDEALLLEDTTLKAVWEKVEVKTNNTNNTTNSGNENPVNNSQENKTIEVTGVSLNTTSKSMIVNTTDKLVATIEPSNASDKTVTWSSDNTSVITVDKNGNIKAVGLGEANITVKTANGKTASAKVISDVKNITLSVTNQTISKYGTNSTKITANIDSNGYNVPNSLITWSAPDTTGYTSAASMSINGKIATITARDVWSSTSAIIPVTVKINNKEAKTTIYVEPKLSVSNRSSSSGVTCNESNGIMLCTFKGEKNFYLRSNIDVSWEYDVSSPVIAGIEGKDARNLKLSVQYVAHNGLNIKARSKSGQVKEIALTPTVQ